MTSDNLRPSYLIPLILGTFLAGAFIFSVGCAVGAIVFGGQQ